MPGAGAARLCFRALVAVALVSCPPTVESPPYCPPEGYASKLPAEDPLGEVGQTLELTVELERPFDCSTRRPNVSGVTVELTDPDGHLVDASATPPQLQTSQLGVESWRTQVSFTPQGPGAFYLLVTFVPEGGQVQFPVWVVEDRRGAVPLVVKTAGSPCNRLERLPSGGIACESTNEPKGVRLLRAGAVESEWPDASYRVAGSSVWVAGTSGLFRVVERSDGGLESTSLPASNPVAFAATADEALLWFDDGFQYVRFTAGQLASESERSTLWLYVKALAFSPDAGTVVAGSATGWGQFTLSQLVTDAGLPWLGGEPALAQGEAGVWVASGRAVGIRYVPADARSTVVDLALPRGWRPWSAPLYVPVSQAPLIFPARPGDVTPTLDRSEVLVPSLFGARPGFWRFKAPEGFTFVDVSGGWLRATRTDLQEHLLFPIGP